MDRFPPTRDDGLSVAASRSAAEDAFAHRAVELTQRTASESLALLRRREINSTALVGACLERIQKRDPVVRAWACVRPDLAMAEARAADSAASAAPAGGDAPDSIPRGALLRGIPVGIKDVFDTHDLPTAMGSSIYRDHRPTADASVVALLRGAGAVILGKTVTAEFAGMAPTATTNPHHPDHTPGGSSSGSAAAVADHMVPIAIGSQTGGSVLRPASYCGVFAFKPTYGRVNRAGLKAAADSLDTVGWMAQSLADIAVVDTVLAGGRDTATGTERPARVGICYTHLWPAALAETRTAIGLATARLDADGIALERCPWPPEFAQLSSAREIINDYERARALAHEWLHHRDQISAPLAAAIERGLATPMQRYVDAQVYAERARLQFDDIIARYDALLAPCVPGEAPRGLGYAGSPDFQALWTLLHVPVIGLPFHRGPTGLPVGIQLIGPRHGDERLLRLAGGVWDALGSDVGAHDAAGWDRDTVAGEVP